MTNKMKKQNGKTKRLNEDKDNKLVRMSDGNVTAYFDEDDMYDAEKDGFKVVGPYGEGEKTKKVKEAIHDPGDTVPVRGVETGKDADNHLLAVKYAEENELGENDTIINTFTPAEKTLLLKMIKDGEFTQLEGAILRMLMSEAGTLEDIGAMIGAVSRRTKGAATSKPAALKEVNRILQVVAKRSKAKFGKEADLSKIRDYKTEMKKIEEFRRKKAKEAEKYAKQQEQEFYKLLKELNQAQAEKGLPKSKYYVRKFAPADKDIGKMKQFGGTPDQK